MVISLLLAVTVNVVQFGSATSSLSYQPDYSKLSTANLVIIVGALADVIITFLAITALFIVRPNGLIESNEKELLKIPPNKSLIKWEELGKGKDWKFIPIQISATSTDSKTAEESSTLTTQIAEREDYFKAMPELPLHMTHIEGGQPVVFHFMEPKPEAAILPVYIIQKDENEPMPSVTPLKSSGSEKKKFERSLRKSEIRTARSFSSKQSSTVTTSSPSSSSTGKISTTKHPVKTEMEKSEATASGSAKFVNESCYFYFYLHYFHFPPESISGLPQ
ncbi:unnamed protein product [Litomosoides sigmodontis]|uniref:Uncharacterized protein n=1 Tax=Litomosoides sigmodontis TaxID=42156 RepID=A0A3P6SZS1_LITSI|nr:unnamed protein product [Litomosoides sigmodontis]